MSFMVRYLIYILVFTGGYLTARDDSWAWFGALLALSGWFIWEGSNQ